MNLNLSTIFAQNGFIAIPDVSGSIPASDISVATVLNNINYYGYTVSIASFDKIKKLDEQSLISFWKDLEITLKNITSSDLEMSKFVVYHNFPAEVLNMDASELYLRQLIIYITRDVDLVREEKKIREESTQEIDCKVLECSSDITINLIYDKLISKKTIWTDLEQEHALFLFEELNDVAALSSFSFKQNGLIIVKFAAENNRTILIDDANDVLRFACSGTSRGTNVKFNKINRKERFFLLNLLEQSKNLEADVSMKQKVWKKFFQILHPNDYSFKNVSRVYDLLYNNKLSSIDSDFKRDLNNGSLDSVELLTGKIGLFIRNFHYIYSHLGSKVVPILCSELHKATVIQLVNFDSYLSSVATRKNFLVTPNGLWRKLQVIPNTKALILKNDLDVLQKRISYEINKKLFISYPHGVVIDPKIKEVKLPTNDLELDFFGRGTSFDIPKNIKTIRTGSFWEEKRTSSVFFDNGVNFLNEDFKPTGTCCWNSSHDVGATFSGDQLNENDEKGRASQFIDMDIDMLVAGGNRYAVWNCLSYSNIPFSEVENLVFSLQLIEDANKGEIFEPSRADFNFHIGGDNKIKYVAYIDLKLRKVVFIDLNLRGQIHSAKDNEDYVSEVLQDIIEHLDFTPSFYDVFKHMDEKVFIADYLSKEHLDSKEAPLFLLYSDKNINLPTDCNAFVFKPQNDKNKFKKIDVTSL